MSARGDAPATQVDPAELLAPGDDAFLWVDREGRALIARGPLAPGASSPGDTARLGLSRFDATPSRLSFRQHAVTTHATAADLAADGDVSLPRLAGEIAAEADRARWRDLVARARHTIEAGAASKIVCARTVRLRAASPVDARTLARSMMRAEGTYRYLVREGEVIFAGASPERLIERRGDVIRTEAVAGTAAAEHDDTPLDQRDKDRREHLAVVLAIEEALAPLTLALEHADEPLIRRVGRVQHLVTPFEGRVAPDTHVLTLAQRLHPTPAVAGTPRDAAIDFIARTEGFDRGWYAGPIGWFDGNGDGELAVALRCVRIEGSAVDLYAGAGIVAGSDPDAEFDETVLKMRSTLASLGFELSA
jgi:salicylate biosynthesis isochorismate synthase